MRWQASDFMFNLGVALILGGLIVWAFKVSLELDKRIAEDEVGVSWSVDEEEALVWWEGYKVGAKTITIDTRARVDEPIDSCHWHKCEMGGGNGNGLIYSVGCASSSHSGEQKCNHSTRKDGQ
jgi:hypothetical protein